MSFALCCLCVVLQNLGEPSQNSKPSPVPKKPVNGIPTTVPLFHLKSHAKLMPRALPGASGMGVFLFMRCGYGADPKGKEGLAHFVEHLSMTGESKDRKPGWTIQEWFRRRPMGTNAMTRKAWTVFFSIGKRAKLLKDLRFFAQLAKGKIGFSQEAMLRERGRLLSEVENMTSRMPGGVLMWKQRTLLDPLGRTGIGTVKDVKRLALKDCEAFRDRYYKPERALFVLVGDVKVEQDRRLLDRLLGEGEKEPFTAPHFSRQDPPTPLKPPSWIGKNPRVGAPFLSLAFRAPGPKTKEAPGFTLAAFYMMRKAMASFRPRGREFQAFFPPAQYPFLEDPTLFFLNRRAKKGESLEELKREMRTWIEARRKDPIRKSTLSFLLRGMEVFFWPEPLRESTKGFLMRNPRALYSLGLSTGTLYLHGFRQDFFTRLKQLGPKGLKKALAESFSFERAGQAALLPSKPGK